MGINANWQQEILSTLAELDKEIHIQWDQAKQIIEFGSYFAVHLVPLDTRLNADQLLALQISYQEQGKLMVQLWEDVWQAKKTQILNRISSFAGLNITLHARKGKIEEIDSKVVAEFLNQHHLQGYVKAKYNYGFYINEVLFAVASFSPARPMKQKGANYMSAELVRFASKTGYTITGGLSKFIKHFIKEHGAEGKEAKISDIMSYADRDWSLGKGYDQLGFQLTETTAPAYVYTDTEKLIRYFPHRLPKAVLLGFNAQNELNLDDYLIGHGFKKVFNTGNLKYHLYL